MSLKFATFYMKMYNWGSYRKRKPAIKNSVTCTSFYLITL